jgi:hypothetical protein
VVVLAAVELVQVLVELELVVLLLLLDKVILAETEVLMVLLTVPVAAAVALAVREHLRQMVQQLRLVAQQVEMQLAVQLFLIQVAVVVVFMTQPVLLVELMLVMVQGKLVPHRQRAQLQTSAAVAVEPQVQQPQLLAMVDQVSLLLVT